MTVSTQIRKSLESVDFFAGLLRSEVDKAEPEFERLLEGYLETRRCLAQQFCLVAQRFLSGGDNVLQAARKKTQDKMLAMFSGRLPERYLKLRGYKGVHGILLQYLGQHVGETVKASKLRILTGDQTHTERRVRDLRDLGFEIEWKEVSGEDQYVLKGLEQDLVRAASIQVTHNIKNHKKLSAAQQAELLRKIEE